MVLWRAYCLGENCRDFVFPYVVLWKGHSAWVLHLLHDVMSCVRYGDISRLCASLGCLQTPAFLSKSVVCTFQRQWRA